MKSFFRNVLANIVAFFIICMICFVFFIILMAFGAMADSGKTKIKGDAVLTLDSEMTIIDSPSEIKENLFSFQLKDRNAKIYDIIEAIKKAKNDDKIKGISLEADFVHSGLTHLDNIRTALEDFKKSGKFVYAYGNNVSQSSYYLGTVADQYYLNPMGGIELKGLSAEVVFLKNFTEKYGIGTQVIRHGDYKAAVEPFIRNEISPENKEQLSVLLNDIWGITSQKMYASRKLSSDQFKTVVDSLYGVLPDLALENKLVDKLIQRSEYDDIIRKKIGLKSDEKINRVSFTQYINSYKESNRTKSDQIAVLNAAGGIYDGEGYDGVYAEDFIKQIQKLTKNDKVKAVVLRINSPGGSANASDQILFELQKLKAKKPLIVSFGDYAASGGYYIAMAADKIYSEPNTLTGSIGVFGVITNVKELANRNGIRSDAVTTNANSNMYSMLNGVSPGALSILNQSVEKTYKRFVYFVTKNRSKTFDQIDAIGGGRVWSGTKAKEIGLVDELGTLNDAIAFAAGKAKLKTYNVSSYPEKKSKFEQIFEGMEEDELTTKLLQKKLGKENFDIFQQITNPKLQNGVVMEMPYKVSID